MGVPLARLYPEKSMTEFKYDIAVIGGGPAGSTAALYLARKGFRTCIIETRGFPRETLCGEFLSREVVRIIEDLQLTKEFQSLNPNPITTFRYCPEDGRTFASNLKFTAYGLKRGSFDTMLLTEAERAGAVLYQPMTVEQVIKIEGGYAILLSGPDGKVQIKSRYVAGAYGKSNPLDKMLHRNVSERRSHLIGVKFHIHKKYFRSMPDHEIHLYTGQKMYCGANMVNDDTVTLCFLESRSAADAPPRTRIRELIKNNPHFSELVSPDFAGMLESFPIYGTPGIYFGPKHQIENGIFMIGDAAQVIAPLAGDGIGMAMESAQILSMVMEEAYKKEQSAESLSQIYRDLWNSSFQKRISFAKKIQQLLFSKTGKLAGELALSVFPFLLPHMIEHTRG
jgi:flavin-dependent dehydrogenase